MQSAELSGSLSYRTVWISDLHLGTKGCRADYLLDFLQSMRCETLYLVGDIVDLWSMRRGIYWPQTHNEVVRHILGRARDGCAVYYLPGNHDELLRDCDGLDFGAVRIRNRRIHQTADGRRFLVTHGDQFDGMVQCSRWASAVGSVAYDGIIAANRWLHIVRRTFGFPYWSLASFLKQRVKNAETYVRRYDAAVLREAREQEVDGIICGHIHRAGVQSDEGLLYCNTGDLVESCTALVEHHDGAMELLHWSERPRRVHYLADRLSARAA